MLQRVGIPALTVVSVLSCTVLSAARPAAGDAISDAKAKAAAIESELTQAQNEMSTLSQQYDEAQYHLTQINSSIATTKANVAADQTQVANDKATLSKAAVANYITDGSAAAQNPIFSGNEQTLGATTEYNKIAEGDISLAVDNLHTAENSLNNQVTQLQGEQSQAQSQVTAEQNAVNQNAQAVAAAEERAGLGEQPDRLADPATGAGRGRRGGQGGTGTTAGGAAAAAAAPAGDPSSSGSGNSASLAGLSQAAPPPSSPGGAGAVQAAESQIGVPYVWGGESPKGSASPGFDCSGLTAWSWGQVGVGLPHYSGAQMSDSTPVPISDLQPGDLLFYGPGGSEHVAMYVGPGTMIEAPFTGASVWLTGLRLGGDFVGAGRP